VDKKKEIKHHTLPSSSTAAGAVPALRASSSSFAFLQSSRLLFCGSSAAVEDEALLEIRSDTGNVGVDDAIVLKIVCKLLQQFYLKM
jgi:hypothetical protein